MNFTAVTAAAPKLPPRIVVLSPAAFADDWHLKPTDDVSIGIRLISDADMRTSRAHAAKSAATLYVHDGICNDPASFNDEFNDALMRMAVSFAAVDPNDVKTPYFHAAQDTVKFALTSEGVRRLYDELVMLHVGSGVSFAPADDDEVHRLARALVAPHGIRRLPLSDAIEVRKMLAYCLERILAADPSAGDAEPDDTDGEESHYTLRVEAADAPQAP